MPYHIPLFRPSRLAAMQSTPCSCLDGDCNYCWNEQVFYQLGLDLVWKENGHWIAGHDRYPEGGTQQLGWYAYCDTFGIPWPLPRLLPDWAITNMDEQHEFDAHFDADLDMEENDRKYTCLILVLILAEVSCSYTLVLLLPSPFAYQ